MRRQACPAAPAKLAARGLSIVVPMLDEAAVLPGLIAHLSGWRDGGCEVVLVDGGSGDGSADLARAAGLRVIDGPRGRARQMNAGAAVCRGEILLFLHADTRLPDDAGAEVVRALSDVGHHWGRFDVHIEGRPAMLRIVGAAMNLRSRLSGIATGDQAIFVRRTLFETIGGFAGLPLMEDIELCTRLRRHSPPACLRARVRTSGRRWEQRGVWRTILLMWRLRWAYWRGVPVERLAKAYRC
ncbi:MAG TPA: TIGR04283 family arsenosugar biosynthesis glycosyltransferase [Thauera sp.]|nr:TIGR04283 family arsenosugar biosynthesis glycosyltransferase [Thauera sp.]HRA80320.1 TIGR04283 family arsenosugar biosynthesis glycosyltransferase [Thauera sp.]